MQLSSLTKAAARPSDHLYGALLLKQGRAEPLLPNVKVKSAVVQ